MLYRCRNCVGLWSSRLSRRHLPTEIRHASFSRKTGERYAKELSRTERRLAERKQKNKERREQAQAAKGKERLEQTKSVIAFPKILGKNFRREHLVALGYRLPAFLALCYLLTSDDISPYTIQGSLGPSMLPTIQFVGDLWLVETGAWYRLLGWDPSLEVGDIVLWRDPSTQRVSCKRIVGLEGDYIQRYGEFVHLYTDREDLAIVWPRDAAERNLDKDCPWDDKTSKDAKEPFRKLNVPSGYCWLEGDCPPFSLDSRHYGPIPLSWIRGRLVLRVWPIWREDDDGNPISSWVSRTRPVPFASIDQYLGKRFNFHRIPSVDSVEKVSEIDHP